MNSRIAIVTATVLTCACFNSEVFAQQDPGISQLKNYLASIKSIHAQYSREETVVASEGDVKRYLRKSSLNRDLQFVAMKGNKTLYGFDRPSEGVTLIGVGTPFAFGRSDEERAARQSVIDDYRRSGVAFDIDSYGSKAFDPPKREALSLAFDGKSLRRNSSWGQGLVLRSDQVTEGMNRGVDQSYLLSVGIEPGMLFGFKSIHSPTLLETLDSMPAKSELKSVTHNDMECAKLEVEGWGTVFTSPELGYAIVERVLLDHSTGRPTSVIRNSDFREVRGIFLPFTSTQEVFAPEWAPAGPASPILKVSISVEHLLCNDINDSIFSEVEYSPLSMVIDRTNEVNGKGAIVSRVPASPEQLARAAQRLSAGRQNRSVFIIANVVVFGVLILALAYRKFRNKHGGAT